MAGFDQIRPPEGIGADQETGLLVTQGCQEGYPPPQVTNLGGVSLMRAQEELLRETLGEITLGEEVLSESLKI